MIPNKYNCEKLLQYVLIIDQTYQFVANLLAVIIQSIFSFLVSQPCQKRSRSEMYIEAQYHNFKAQRPKSDIVYYQAFKSCSSTARNALIFKLLLSTSMLILFIINYLNDKLYEDTSRAILVNLVASLIGVAVKMAEIKNIYSNTLVFLSLAEINSHAVVDEIVYNFQRIQDCVSARVYVAGQNLNESDLDDQTKKAYKDTTLRTFKIDVSKRYRGLASAQRFHSAFSFTTIIYSIVALCQDDLSPLNITFLSIYVTLVGISQFVLLVGLILVAFIPLICILYCIFACFCKKSTGNIVDAELKKATMEDIIRVDGGCSICYQNYAQSEMIYVLPCSDLHIFHKGCLENWVRVKQTCPNCRSPVPMRNQP